MSPDEDALRAALRGAPSPTPPPDLADTAIAHGQRIRQRRRLAAVCAACALIVAGIVTALSLNRGMSAVPVQPPSQNPVLAPTASDGASQSPAPALSPGGTAGTYYPTPGTEASGVGPGVVPGGGVIAGQGLPATIVPSLAPDASGSSDASTSARDTGAAGADGAPDDTSAGGRATAPTAPSETPAARRTPSPAGSPSSSSRSSATPTASVTTPPMTLSHRVLDHGVTCAVPDEWDITDDSGSVLQAGRDSSTWMTCGSRTGAGTLQFQVDLAVTEAEAQPLENLSVVQDPTAGTATITGTRIDGQTGVPVVKVRALKVSGDVTASTLWEYPQAERDAFAPVVADAVSSLSTPKA